MNLKQLANTLGWAEVEELAEQLEQKRLWQRPESNEDEATQSEGAD